MRTWSTDWLRNSRGGPSFNESRNRFRKNKSPASNFDHCRSSTLRYNPHTTFTRPAKKLSVSKHHPAMQSSCIRPSYLSTLDYLVKVPADFGNPLLGVLDETAAFARTVQVKHNSQRRTHGWKRLGFLAVFRKDPSKQTKQAFSSLFRIFGQTRRAEKDVIVIKRSPQQAEKINTNPPYRSRQAQERMHTPGRTKWKH